MGYSPLSQRAVNVRACHRLCILKSCTPLVTLSDVTKLLVLWRGGPHDWMKQEQHLQASASGHFSLPWTHFLKVSLLSPPDQGLLESSHLLCVSSCLPLRVAVIAVALMTNEHVDQEEVQLSMDLKAGLQKRGRQ